MMVTKHRGIHMLVRRLFLLVPLVAACAPEASVELHARSMLSARTEGVVLHDGGRFADAAMEDALCVIDTGAPLVVGDRDPAEGSERLLDAIGTTTLASGGGILWALDQDGTDAELLHTETLDARFLGGGVAALVADGGACGVAFTGSEAAWSVGGDCSDQVGFAVDPASEMAWLADGERLVGVDASGEGQSFEVGADLVAWDAADGWLVVAEEGGDFVAAVSPGGDVGWSVAVDGAVRDIATASAEGLVVVSVEQPDGGEIVVLDGATGEQIVSHLTPEAPEVEVSGDGLSLALVTGDAVYFYDVDPNANPMDTPTTEQMEGLRGVGGGAVAGTALFTAAMIVD
jgi:hypothetical protein